MSTLRWLGLSVAAVEGTATVKRFFRRRDYYNDALARATETERHLVVVGDPKAGATTRILPATGSGDLCIDLTGCPSSENGLAADITKRVDVVKDDSAVVFVSCVLEYVDDIQAAWAEIVRMAGSPSNIFIVTVEPWSLTARLYPGAKWVIDKAPPEGTELVYRPVSTESKVIAGTVVAGSAGAIVWPDAKG